MSTEAEPPPTRIRVRTMEDINILYPLILDFAQNPGRASRVTEFVLRAHPQVKKYSSMEDFPADWDTDEDASTAPPGSPMWDIVRRIGLAPNEEARWAKMLAWMDPDVVTSRNAAQNALEKPWVAHTWIEHHTKIFAQYAAAALLTLCPAIEMLMYEDPGASSPVPNFLARNNAGSLSMTYLSKLQTVVLLPTDHHWLDHRFYNELDPLRLMHLFHRLPNIDNFSADAFTPRNEVGFGDESPPKLSKVKHIRMRHVSLPSTVIAAIVRMPRALEDFVCTVGGRASSDGGKYIVFPEAIGKALWCQRISLRKLDLDIDDHISPTWPEWAQPPADVMEEFVPDGPVEVQAPQSQETAHNVEKIRTKDLNTGREHNSTIGSLYDFHVLTHLSTSIEALLGPRDDDREDVAYQAPFRLVDALPRSLEYLLIRGYKRGEETSYDQHLDELLAVREERLPNLRTIGGLEECVAVGRDVLDPDNNPGELWQPQISAEW